MKATVFNRSGCPTALKRLGAYVDGELQEARRQQVEAHVGSCQRCAAELERLRALGEHLRSSLAVPMPRRDADLFWEKVERKIQEAKVPRWWTLDRIRGMLRSHPGLAWGSVAVMGAVIVLFSVDLLLRPSPRRPAQLVPADLSLRTIVESVEGGPNSSVVLLSTPDRQLKIIWVLERKDS